MSLESVILPLWFRKSLAALSVLGWMSIIALSMLPGSSRPHTGAGGVAEHAIAYAIVALFGGLSALGGSSLLLIGGGLTLTAAALELIQFFVPGRTPEVQGFLAGAGAHGFRS